MIVLAESNFVLELALQQEELDEADRLVAMAEAREIELVIPACALFEPYETLVRRRKARAALLERLRGEEDFLTPKIESYLELLNCRLLSKFSTGRQFVESHARRSQG